MGDFNLNLINTNSRQVNDFTNNMYATGFYPTISKPTRIANHLATIIDNIFTNITQHKIHSGILYTDISDHLPIFNINDICNLPLKPGYKTLYRRNKSEKNLAKLKIKLKCTNWDDIYNESNPDASYNAFINTFNTLIDEYLPIKKVKIRDNPSSEWLTMGILTSSKHKNILYKQFKKSPTVDNETTYKTYKNKLTHIIRLSKKNHYKNKFDLQKGNARKSWQLNKEVLKCKPKVTTPSTSFTLLDGSETSNPKDIANEFNDYFIHVASNLVKDIPTTGDDPTEFVQTNTNSFFCRPTTPEEIVSLLCNIKSNTSSGFDNVEPHIMREISPQIAPLLSHIFNNSFYWSGTTSTKNRKSNSNT